MKRFLSILIALALMALNSPAYGNDEAFSECEYGVNDGYEDCDTLGQGASSSSSSAISASMVGWGLGMVIAIAIVAGVIHQSTSSHSDSNSS